MRADKKHLLLALLVGWFAAVVFPPSRLLNRARGAASKA